MIDFDKLHEIFSTVLLSIQQIAIPNPWLLVSVSIAFSYHHLRFLIVREEEKMVCFFYRAIHYLQTTTLFPRRENLFELDVFAFEFDENCPLEYCTLYVIG